MILLNVVTSAYLFSILLMAVWTNIRPIHINEMKETKLPAWHYYQLQYNTTNEEPGELGELDDVYIVTLALINLVLLAVVGI